MSLNNKDRIYRYISECGSFRLSFTKSTTIVKSAITRHSLNPLESILLGEALTTISLASSFLKDDDVVSIKVNNAIFAEAGKTGEVRGYIDPSKLGKLKLTGSNRTELIQSYLQDAVLQITHWKDRKPKDSFVKMKNGLIGPDMTEYYLQSEQITSAIQLDLALDNKFQLNYSYGYLVQTLPGITNENLETLKFDIIDSEKMGLLASTNDVKQVASKIFKNFKLKELDSYLIDFYCRCSKKSFAKSMATLEIKELQEMAADGTQEIICQFCSEKYYYSPDELTEFIDNKKA